MRGVRTSRFAIADYWSQRCPRFVQDLARPACFACGFYESDWDLPRTAVQRWNCARLERAHIVGRAIGGADSPGNYLLLCQNCHVVAPMTNEPRWMIQWAQTRETHADRVRREFREEFARLGGTAYDAILVSLAPPERVFSACREMRLDAHPSNRAGTSSIAALAIEVANRERSRIGDLGERGVTANGLAQGPEAERTGTASEKRNASQPDDSTGGEVVGLHGFEPCASTVSR